MPEAFLSTNCIVKPMSPEYANSYIVTSSLDDVINDHNTGKYTMVSGKIHTLFGHECGQSGHKIQ